MKRILSIALNNGGGKWEVGTIIDVYKVKQKFNWGDYCASLLIMAESFMLDKSFLEEVKWRKWKINRAATQISESSFLKYVVNVKIIQDKYLKRQDAVGVNKAREEAKAYFKANGIYPRLDDKIVDLDTPDILKETNPLQWKDITPLPEYDVVTGEFI